ncbi:MAG: diguanylate cyclase [Candidatus Eremiobacteraeota bacterium]|nr:diguanylate cyclase [Candidatus Eremiobacteraeota bacterium]
MIVVALVAIFQTSVVFRDLAARGDAAHIVDLSGIQRDRSQTLCYLALSLRGTKDDAPVRAEIDATIAAMIATRADIFREPKWLTGQVDRRGLTPLAHAADAFLALIRAIERRPADPALLARLREQRPVIFDAFDRAVKMRVALARAENERLMGLLLFGLALQIATIVGSWVAIVAPAERRNLRLLADIRQARNELEATFDGNPDGIAVYDVFGRLIRVNATRAQFIGRPAEELVGAHITEVVDPRFVQASVDGFRRAMRGETVRFDSSLLAGDGSPVDISVAIFPRVIDSEVVGVNVVSKDMRELRAAEAANAEQTQRLADLYEIASSFGATTDQLLASAIDLVTHRLGYDYGAVTEIVDDVVTVVATSGSVEGVSVGDARPLESSFARLVVGVTDFYEDRDFAATQAASDGAAGRWASVSGMKIFIGGVLYGAIGFASRSVRAKDLSASDVSFMRLSCALLGTIIERGRQIRRLDVLAFSDSLTELPNRARFGRALEDAIAKNAPFALHYVDLDRFKEINDRFGHATGDEVLKIAAQRLLDSTRPRDTVVRLGGDEFAVVQADASTREEVGALAQRIVCALDVPIRLDGSSYGIGASVGVALYPEHAKSTRALIDAADAALYRAKEAGRGRHAFAQAASRTTKAS